MKWFLELKRFDESFTALDGQLLRHCLNETELEGEWPGQYAKAILPFSLFDSDLILGRTDRRRGTHQGLLNLDPPPKFDLVIVDEAHHLRNSETYLHQGVRYFCDNAQAVVFLTATPVQLGSEDLYTLLNALRPDLVIDHASFEQMAEPNRYINAAIGHCRAAKEGWPQEALRSMEDIAGTEWGRLFLSDSPEFQDIHSRLQEGTLNDERRIGVIRDLEELYTFSPLISRTRRRDVGKFTTRKPETLTIEFTPAQQKLHDDLLDVVSRILAFVHGQQNVKFMMTTIRRQASSCLYGLAPLLRDMLNGKLDQLEAAETNDVDDVPVLSFSDQVRAEIANLLEQVDQLDSHDPKIEAFVRVLADKGKRDNNKALVFSTFRHTLAYLQEHVRRAGMRCGLIHGGVPDEERADLRRRFALGKADTDAIDVLLCSEVGCEGLDFQFCDFLVNYDFPWNPMKIEQRIGRIDRYGQKSETVGIITFVTPGTVDADIYERCLWRIGIFQDAIGGSEEILGRITQELHDISDSFSLTPTERQSRLRQLADNGIRQLREEQELESSQAELFGLDVPNQSWRRDIDAAQSYWLSPPALQNCVSAYLSARLKSGAEHLLGDKSLKKLRLNEEARSSLLADYKRLPRSTEPVFRDWEKWLKGAQPLLAVTFDQETAAEHPDAMHLSVMHPLVRQAAWFLKRDEPGVVALSVQTDDVPAGDYPFALYRWQMRGVKRDERLVAVASDPAVDNALLSLLQIAGDAAAASSPPQAELDALDVRHHARWSQAQADHIAENRRQVEYRIQSLAASHRARRRAIEDQIARATDEKIRIMKRAELERADADHNRHLAELQQAAASGDIHATAVLFGTLFVQGAGNP